MTLIVDKSNAKELPKLLSSIAKKKSKKGNLAKRFGKLKRNLDGLKYQLSIRQDED